MLAKLDKSGRVLIPKAIRQNLGLKPGQALELQQFDKKIIIEPNFEKKSNSKQLGVFEDLLKYNQRFDLEIDSDIDISQLASEVNG